MLCLQLYWKAWKQTAAVYHLVDVVDEAPWVVQVDLLERLNWEPRCSLSGQHEGAVNLAAFSPNGVSSPNTACG